MVAVRSLAIRVIVRSLAIVVTRHRGRSPSWSLFTRHRGRSPSWSLITRHHGRSPSWSLFTRHRGHRSLAIVVARHRGHRSLASWSLFKRRKTQTLKKNSVISVERYNILLRSGHTIYREADRATWSRKIISHTSNPR